MPLARRAASSLFIGSRLGLASLAVIGTVWATPAPTQPAVQPDPVRSLDAAESSGGLLIRAGDKVKLKFYEALDDEEGKWRSAGGRSVTAPRSFHERAELTGEYTVQSDGLISIPLIGMFQAAGQSKAGLVGSLGPALERLIGRKGYVSVLSVEQRPIYIVGSVKNPGSFKFEAGVTALHAVALAGGMLRSEAEAWQNIESRREIVALGKSLDRVKRLLARTSVLKAARGEDRPSMKEFVSLVGQQDSKLLLDQEVSQQRLSELNRAVQGSALKLAIDNYRAELDARLGRLAPFEQTIKLRSERVKGLQTLFDRKLTTETTLVQAQGELSEIQDRRQQAVIDVAATKEKLARSEQDLAKHNLETRLAIEQAIASAESDSADAVVATEGSLNVLRTFGNSAESSDDENAASFEILRAGAAGARLIPATETTILQPGDLIRIQTRSGRRKND